MTLTKRDKQYAAFLKSRYGASDKQVARRLGVTVEETIQAWREEGYKDEGPLPEWTSGSRGGRR